MKSKPIRIQLSRKCGWRKPENTVVVARPSKFGNPHNIGLCRDCGIEHTRAEAIAEFEAMVTMPVIGDEIQRNIRRELRGKNLACWCKIGTPCHADVLLRIANT